MTQVLVNLLEGVVTPRDICEADKGLTLHVAPSGTSDGLLCALALKGLRAMVLAYPGMSTAAERIAVSRHLAKAPGLEQVSVLALDSDGFSRVVRIFTHLLLTTLDFRPSSYLDNESVQDERVCVANGPQIAATIRQTCEDLYTKSGLSAAGFVIATIRQAERLARDQGVNSEQLVRIYAEALMSVAAAMPPGPKRPFNTLSRADTRRRKSTAHWKRQRAKARRLRKRLVARMQRVRTGE